MGMARKSLPSPRRRAAPLSRGRPRRALPWSLPRLEGKVAVVTGASRGVGRGIALVLGEAGATVYVTARSVRGESTVDGLPGTIEDTAEAVTARGGKGIPVRCDHSVEGEVEALFGRVRREQDRLDLLVNNAWGGYEHYFGRAFEEGAPFAAPFWKQSLRRWDGMFTAGVRAHLLASYFAIPLMLKRRRGLLVGTSAGDRDRYLGNLFYDVAKTAVARMGFAMGRELRLSGIAAVTLLPGFVRTERVLAAFQTDEDHWREVPDLAESESTAYVGRAVAALAGDPGVIERSGRVLAVGDLAREYGFTDVDGRQPPRFEILDEE
jgi:NAD(P)-dependent dehydrogenase (short-subunit alcohol dehydrogenase family)